MMLKDGPRDQPKRMESLHAQMESLEILFQESLKHASVLKLIKNKMKLDHSISMLLIQILSTKPKPNTAMPRKTKECLLSVPKQNLQIMNSLPIASSWEKETPKNQQIQKVSQIEISKYLSASTPRKLPVHSSALIHQK
jgi:hypothetical protein